MPAWGSDIEQIPVSIEDVAVVKLCLQLPANLKETASAYTGSGYKGSYVFGGGSPDPDDYVVRFRASYDTIP